LAPESVQLEEIRLFDKEEKLFFGKLI